MKLLVTGGSGFIGSRLTALLVRQGYTVSVLTRGKGRLESYSWAKDVKVVEAGLDDRDKLKLACKGIDRIIHCAGYAHNSRADYTTPWEVNYQGTVNLLETAIEEKVEGLIFLSSNKVRSKKQTPYSRSKSAAEKTLLEAHRSKSIKVCILRPAGVYGVGMKGNLAGWLNRIKADKAPILPLIDTRIALIGVDDLVKAVAVTLESESLWGKKLLLTDGKNYRIKDIEIRAREVLDKKNAAFPLPKPVFFLAAKAGDLIGSLTSLNIGFNSTGYNTLFSDEYEDGSEFRLLTGYNCEKNLFECLPELMGEVG